MAKRSGKKKKGDPLDELEEGISELVSKLELPRRLAKKFEVEFLADRARLGTREDWQEAAERRGGDVEYMMAFLAAALSDFAREFFSHAKASGRAGERVVQKDFERGLFYELRRNSLCDFPFRHGNRPSWIHHLPIKINVALRSMDAGAKVNWRTLAAAMWATCHDGQDSEHLRRAAINEGYTLKEIKAKHKNFTQSMGGKK